MVVVDPAVVLFVTALATALAGTLVGATAYRGYRRHDSGTMQLLAIGILLITVSPFLISYVVTPLIDLQEAVGLLGILLANIAGLLAIIYSLEA